MESFNVPPPLPKSFPHIRLVCDVNYGTGYNNAARGLIQVLEVLGYNSKRLRVVGGTGVLGFDEDNDWFYPYISDFWADNKEDQINIVCLNPGMVNSWHTTVGDRRNIAYCAWETDRLTTKPYDFGTLAQALSRYDQVWVPTNHVANVFRTSGVTAPIHVVPHAVQREVYALPVEPPKGSAGSTMFYTLGAWNVLKDPRALLMAYLRTFTSNHRVKLHLHCVPPTREAQVVELHGLMAEQEVKDIYASLPEPDLAPSFGLFVRPRPFSWVIDFAAQRDVFVTASHGEGFCLPAAEAAVLGRTVIGGGGPALEDLKAVAPALVHLVERREVSITPIPERAGYELSHKWWTVDEGALQRRLLNPLGHDWETRREAQLAARAFYHPDTRAFQVRELLEEVMGG